MNKVKMYRGLCLKSQKEMADILGISENQYRNKENGKYDFKESEMYRFMVEVRKYAPNTIVEDIFFSSNLPKPALKTSTVTILEP